MKKKFQKRLLSWLLTCTMYLVSQQLLLQQILMQTQQQMRL